MKGGGFGRGWLEVRDIYTTLLSVFSSFTAKLRPCPFPVHWTKVYHVLKQGLLGSQPVSLPSSY